MGNTQSDPQKDGGGSPTAVAAALEEEVDLAERREQLAVRKYKYLLLTFVDDETETAYGVSSNADFMKWCLLSDICHALRIVITIIYQAAFLSPDVALYVVEGVALVVSVFFASFSTAREALPALGHYIRFMVVFVAEYFIICFMATTLTPVTINNYFMMLFAVLLNCLVGSPHLNWVATVVVDTTFYCWAPGFALAAQNLMDPTVVPLFVLAFTVFFIVACRGKEQSLRSQFLDLRVGVLADQAIAVEHKRIHYLLSRSIPKFALQDLMTWLGSDRSSVISLEKPNVAVLFVSCSATTLQLRSADSRDGGIEEESRATLERTNRLVRVYNATLDLADFEECVTIKTFGDVLLVAHGIATSGPETDAGLLALLACGIDRAVRADLGETIVAGLHVGPVSAGVLGEQRLIFDVFGDTVNTASRVMSSSATLGLDGAFASEKAAAAIRAGLHQASVVLGDPETRDMKGKGNATVFRIVRPGVILTNPE